MRALLSSIVLSLLTLSLNANAVTLQYSPNGPSADKVTAFRATFDPIVQQMKGFSGIGTGACEEQSGVEFIHLTQLDIDQSLFVNCIIVGLKTDADVAAFQVLFPPKINGIFVNVEKMGTAVAQ